MQAPLTFKPWPLALLIAMLALSRLPNAAQLTPWANFTPIGAMALFGGACFASRWQAWLVPLASLLLSDLVINLFIFRGQYGAMYSGWPIIYGAFALIVLIGRTMLARLGAGRILLAGLAGSLCHWLLADFSVWIGGGLDLRTGLPLPKTLDGLVQCYLQGWPFFRNFLAGTWVYSAALFGTMYLLRKYRPNWVMVPIPLFQHR